MTKILVAIGDSRYAEDFMIALLPKGLEVYIIERQDVLLSIAKEKNPDIIVFDCDIDEFHGLQGLQELRTETGLKEASVILFSKESGIDFIKDTMSMGVVGYLYKPISSRNIEIQMEKLLSTITTSSNLRAFVRVKPEQLEETLLEVILEDGSSISGKIVDISLGGVSMKLKIPEKLSKIKIGNIYINSHLYLYDEPEIKIDVEAVLAKGNMAAFKFKNVNESMLKIMCHYIHEKLINLNNRNSNLVGSAK